MNREELKGLTKEEMGRRIRKGVKAAIGQVLEEEMAAHLGAVRRASKAAAGSKTATTPGVSSRRRARWRSFGYPGRGLS
jgi:transposase-like protein